MKLEVRKTTINMPKMDCPSEERLVRMALEKTTNVKNMSFDLVNRRLSVIHEGEAGDVLELLLPLKLGATISDTRKMNKEEEVGFNNDDDRHAVEGKVLGQLLAINGIMFVIEMILGWYAQSTGLIADSLDMLSDASVYGLSFYVVKRSKEWKRRAAQYSGYLQLLLALGALMEVGRRFIFGSEPMAPFMIGVALVALAANVTCLLLLARHRTGEIHMRASWIFSTNDVIANVGVIGAGILVIFTSSRIPDLVIGSIISAVVAIGAVRILKLSRI